jgi:hypothetical protein
MPMFYDYNRSFTTSGSGNTEVIELGITPGALIMGIYGLYGACRFLTAGGAQLKLKSNTGSAFGGGSASITWNKKNTSNPTAVTTAKDGGTAITAGGTLVVRHSVGLAQTGGSGGWQAIMPQDAFQGYTTNPVDFEISTVAATASVTGDFNTDIGEGL